ncbi:hypothetical protein [Amycolatopsis orientalis]|uniref:hypothetical protein n=1 Tax=Amycolatopsis orientalis TaxID=31958 RepID=UPI0003A2CCCD|nr:hypothetical protein [Amycolatopsis orientalis]
MALEFRGLGEVGAAADGEVRRRAFKKALHGWIDYHLDPGTMLGQQDPFVGALRATDCKVYEFDTWPTVEDVAALLGELSGKLLAEADHVPGATVAAVEVQETHVNRAGSCSASAADVPEARQPN